MKNIWAVSCFVIIAFLHSFPCYADEKLKIEALVLEAPTSEETTFAKQLIEIYKLMGNLKSDVWVDVGFTEVSKANIPAENTVAIKKDKDTDSLTDIFYNNLNKYCSNRTSGSTLFISNPVLEGQETIYANDEKIFFTEIEHRSFDVAMIQDCIEFVEAATLISDSTRKIYLPDLIPDLSKFNLRELPKILPLAILRKDWSDISGLIEPESEPKEFLVNLNIDPFSNYHAEGDITKAGVHSQPIMEFVKNPKELDANLIVFAIHLKGADWWTIPDLNYKKPVTEPRLEIPGYFMGISAIRTVETFLNP